MMKEAFKEMGVIMLKGAWGGLNVVIGTTATITGVAFIVSAIKDYFSPVE